MHLICVCLQGTADTSRLRVTMHLVLLNYLGILYKRNFGHWQAHSFNFTFQIIAYLANMKSPSSLKMFGPCMKIFRLTELLGILMTLLHGCLRSSNSLNYTIKIGEFYCT